ncbi:reverse transcriptase [Phytophthora megakarya]|uniref:Reverse transcriptase n=1 Tax=Phytophthora megakarya TaxID=4795 RepID=A0A225UD97_9STRA|nr:reverse transcriptase [Phytophthora megakarya]
MSLALTDPPVSSEVETPTARSCGSYLRELWDGSAAIGDLWRHKPVRSEIDCKAPGLTLLRQKALDRLRIRPDHELVHVKRDWNGSEDSLASAALQRKCGIEVETDSEIQDLMTLNRLDELLVAISGVRSGSNPPVLCEEVIRELRIQPPGIVRRSDQRAQDRADSAGTGGGGVDPPFEEVSGGRNTRSDTGRGQILRIRRYELRSGSARSPFLLSHYKGIGCGSGQIDATGVT